MYEDIPIRRYKADAPGYEVKLSSGVHAGVETKPIDGMQRLISEFDSGIINVERGQVTIMPICNPPAFRARVRWFDERNLNRMIRRYPNPANAEQHFADQIATELDAPGVKFLDAHTFRADTIKDETAAFLTLDFPTQESIAVAKALGVHIVTGWPQMNEKIGTLSVEDTTNYAYLRGNIGITIECGTNDDPESAEVSYRVARRFLAYYGLLSNTHDLEPTGKSMFLNIEDVVLNSGTDTKDTELLVKPINFGRVAKGEPIARHRDGSIEVARDKYRMVMPSRHADPGEDLTYLAREIDMSSLNETFIPGPRRPAVPGISGP